MAPIFRLLLPTFVILTAGASPNASCDERGAALVRQASERMSASLPLFVAYTTVLTQNRVSYSGQVRCTLVDHGIRPVGAYTGVKGNLAVLTPNLQPLPALTLDPHSPDVPFNSAQYIDKETIDGKPFDVVELTEPVLRSNLDPESGVHSDRPLGQAVVRWYLDESRFIRRVRLVQVEDAIDAAGNRLPLELEGDITGESIVSEIRKPRVVEPRRAFGGTAQKFADIGGRVHISYDGRIDVVLSPDRSLIARLVDNSVVVLDTSSAKPRFRLDLPGELRGAAFSPDGAQIVVAVSIGLQVYETKSGRQQKAIESPSPVYGPVFSPDGNRIAAACSDHTVRMWNARSGALELELNQPAFVVAFSPDGKRLAAWGFRCDLQLWETTRWQPLQSLKIQTIQSNFPFAFSPDAKWIAAVGDDSSIQLFDCSTPQAQRSWKGVGAASCIRWSPDGANVITVDHDERPDKPDVSAGLSYWDAASGMLRNSASLSRPGFNVPWKPQLSADGKTIFYECQEARFSPNGRDFGFSMDYPVLMMLDNKPESP